jgi:hypothetical protein
MLASVRTLVVSWNEAAKMKLSVESEALVMPRRSGVPSAGSPPRFITFSFFFMKHWRAIAAFQNGSLARRFQIDLGERSRGPLISPFQLRPT